MHLESFHNHHEKKVSEKWRKRIVPTRKTLEGHITYECCVRTNVCIPIDYHFPNTIRLLYYETNDSDRWSNLP